MINWGRRQPDLSPWQAFAWKGATYPKPAVLDGIIMCVPLMNGSVINQSALQSKLTQIIPVLDAITEVQG